jgi:hypothetical protein
MTAEQLPLPGVDAPHPRARTKHAYGGGDRCKHCGVRRRYEATGLRKGRFVEWSHDGLAWQRSPGECIAKK